MPTEPVAAGVVLPEVWGDWDMDHWADLPRRPRYWHVLHRLHRWMRDAVNGARVQQDKMGYRLLQQVRDHGLKTMKKEDKAVVGEFFVHETRAPPQVQTFVADKWPQVPTGSSRRYLDAKSVLLTYNASWGLLRKAESQSPC